MPPFLLCYIRCFGAIPVDLIAPQGGRILAGKGIAGGTQWSIENVCSNGAIG
jgi:hypothetical protein